MDVFLPNNIIPIEYFIKILPIEPHYKKFFGKCSIYYEKKQKTSKIMVHSSNIKLLHVTLKNDIRNYDINLISNENQMMIFKCNKIPKMGIITFWYIGHINNKPQGLCKMITNNKIIIYTHFQPIYARQCFPCFDEPKFKAIYNIQIIANKKFSVLSNTELKLTKRKSKIKNLYMFDRTPPMSSYLVAFYIGTLDTTYRTINTQLKSQIKIGIHSNNKTSKFINFIINEAIICLQYINNLFKIEYSLSKLDLIFVPSLEASAMENWGLIIIKDDYSEILDYSDKINLIYTIYHEIAHQWFGNLVTTSNWSELWLNESFASWLGWYILKKQYPNYLSDEYFYISEMLSVLYEDSLSSTRNICNNNIYNDGEIFDSITYTKGATIISMIINCMGIQNFLKGLKQYFKKFAYKNVYTSDIIKCLDNNSEYPIAKILNSWLNNKNYPLLDISMKNNSQILITQNVCSYNDTKNICWYIPLNNSILIQKKYTFVESSIFDKVLNSHAFDFYIINYDEELLFKIFYEKFHILTNLDISKLMTNIFLSYIIEKISFDKYLRYLLEIINRLSEPSILITSVLNFQYNKIKAYVNNKKISYVYYNILTDYIDKNLKIISDDNIMSNKILGIDLIQDILLNMAIDIGINKYVLYFDKIFIKFIYGQHIDEKLIKLSIKNAICNGTQYTIKKNCNILWQLYYKDLYTYVILTTMGYTVNKKNYLFLLHLVILGDYSNNLKLHIIHIAGENKKLNIYLWYFIKENWSIIYDNFYNDQFSIIKIFSSLENIIDDKNIIDDIKHFFSNEIKYNIAVNKVIEHIKINTKKYLSIL